MTTAEVDTPRLPLQRPRRAGARQGIRTRHGPTGTTPGPLAYGEPAWLATRYADARLVLGDRRFSRAEAPTREPRQSEGQPTAAS